MKKLSMLGSRETRLNRRFPLSHRRQLAFNPRAHWADMGPSFGGGFRTNFASKIAPDLSF
jgi:hypothetical protein